MLIDEVEIILKAGHGGAGRVSFYPKMYAGPDGGNGGKGGDLLVKVTSDLTALNQFAGKKEFAAENGQPGGRNLQTGKGGSDLTLNLPIGSVLTDKDSNEILELNEIGQVLLVCKGGLGGRGNADFKSSRNTTPRHAQPGLPGEKRSLLVELKLIADFGLVGLPNAGKSSLLNELTSASVKTAEYPFTTLEPNLGTLNGKIIADIPGLIEGASIGKGLGIKFLKHIEKVSLLLHCLAADSENIFADYQIVRNEIETYNPELINKPETILLTKSDLILPKTLKAVLTKLKKVHKKVITVSIHDFDSLESLKKYLLDLRW